MDEWRASKSNVRIALGLVLIIAGFVWLALFFEFMPISPSNILVGWLGAIITGFFFFSAICISFDDKAKKAIVVGLVCLLWSLGFLVLPVPEGYAETVYGGWAIIFMALVILYAKYESSQKRKTSAQKETESHE